jgi:hypothetical protein
VSEQKQFNDKFCRHRLVFFFLDSKSWTPKILNDIVGRKKIQGECKDYKDNPLELLPEKRSKVPKPSNPQTERNSIETGNEQSLTKAINLLLTEVFCSTQQSPSVDEIMKGDSMLAKSLNYLFIDAGDNNC